jgi:hypothetical protein
MPLGEQLWKHGRQHRLTHRWKKTNATGYFSPRRLRDQVRWIQLVKFVKLSTIKAADIPAQPSPENLRSEAMHSIEYF